MQPLAWSLSGLTGGTNTAAAMVVGTGSSLTAPSSGAITARSLRGLEDHGWRQPQLLPGRRVYVGPHRAGSSHTDPGVRPGPPVRLDSHHATRMGRPEWTNTWPLLTLLGPREATRGSVGNLPASPRRGI